MEVDLNMKTFEYFVASGVFSLTVYAGEMPDGIVRQLKEPADPHATDISHSQKVLKEALADNMITELGQTSIIVRLVDTQRKMHFLDNFEQRKPDTRYLLPQHKGSHAYKKDKGGAPLKKLMTGQELETYNLEVENKFKEHLDIV